MSKTKKNNPSDMKTDELAKVEGTLSKAETFIEKNRKILSYVLLGIVVIVVGIMGYNKFIKQPKEKSAYEEMFIAEYYFEVDSFNLALFGDGNYLGFLDIIDEYKRTKAGNLAHYYVGMIYMHQRNFDEAISYLKRYKSNDLILSSMALGAIGDAYVEKGDIKSAVDYYYDAATNKPNAFTSPIFLMRAGWAYEELGEYKKALDSYLTIKEKYFRTFEGREIDKHIAKVEIKLKK